MRLAKGMTYKNAAAGINLGGGKSVIIGDPRKDKSEALFRAFGRFVESLNGRYITAEDVGTKPKIWILCIKKPTMWSEFQKVMALLKSQSCNSLWSI